MSGYGSIGHIFELAETQSNNKIRLALGNFITKLFVECDENVVSRIGFRQFNTYFDNVQVSVNSATSYLRGVLKQHHVNDLDFELKVERSVWNLLLTSFDFKCKIQTYDHSDDPENDEDFCYQLFCLFNRFCDTKKVPMALSHEALNFLLQKFGIAELVSRSMPTRLLPFIEYVYTQKRSNATSAVKNAYDEFCRDILIENRISLRFRSKLDEPITGIK